MAGTAAAANNFLRQIGASVGAALARAPFTMRLASDVAAYVSRMDNLLLATLTPPGVDKPPPAAAARKGIGRAHV